MATTTRKLLNTFGALLPAFLLTPSGYAGVVQNSTVLPPAAGAYIVDANVCLLGGCIVEAAIGGLTPVSSTFGGGNQFVTASGTLTADVFENVGGSPGAPIGTLSLPGTLDITYLGRTSGDELGTFPSLLTGLDFEGAFNGHTLEARLNPVPGGNTGSTTISRLDDTNLYLVDSFFDVFVELSVDSGPFIPRPERHVTLVPTVPEPGSASLALLGFAGLGLFAWNKRRGVDNRL